MNRIALLTLALAVAGVSATALAQSAPQDGPRHEHRDGARHHRGMAMHGRHFRHHGGIAMLDKDQDGRIARAELAGGGRRMDRLAERFDAIDANHDGYLVRTEMQSWGKAMREQRQARRAERHAQRFAQADLDKDGRLGKVEASEAMPRLARHFAWMDDNRDGYLDRNELRPRR